MFWLLRKPDLAAPYSATAAPVVCPAVLPSSAWLNLLLPRLLQLRRLLASPCANEVLFDEGPLPGIIEWGASIPYLTSP